MDEKNRKLITDVGLFSLCLLFAWWLINTTFLLSVIKFLLPLKFIAAFLAGSMFTSFLTAPVSIAAFLVLADEMDPLVLILVGGLGAAVGDILIIKLFRDSLFQDFSTLSRDLKMKRFFHYFRHSHFSHFAPFLGAMIIASPFPDEVGLALLGVSKLSFKKLALITYLLNSVGIAILVYLGSVI